MLSHIEVCLPLHLCQLMHLSYARSDYVIKLQEGSVHTVKIARLMDYGAIVEFPSGSSSLLHISQLSHTRVRKATWLSLPAAVT